MKLPPSRFYKDFIELKGLSKEHQLEIHPLYFKCLSKFNNPLDMLFFKLTIRLHGDIKEILIQSIDFTNQSGNDKTQSII